MAGSGNLGVGVELTNDGELTGNGLTVSDMETGINSVGGSINLDGYTSSANSNGIVAQGSPKLPSVYSSAVLQGIATNNNPGTMDNCLVSNSCLFRMV